MALHYIFYITFAPSVLGCQQQLRTILPISWRIKQHVIADTNTHTAGPSSADCFGALTGHRQDFLIVPTVCLVVRCYLDLQMVSFVVASPDSLSGSWIYNWCFLQQNLREHQKKLFLFSKDRSAQGHQSLNVHLHRTIMLVLVKLINFCKSCMLWEQPETLTLRAEKKNTFHLKDVVLKNIKISPWWMKAYCGTCINSRITCS